MKLTVVVFSLLFFISCAVQAQSDQPLVLQINGQLYRWSIGDSEPSFTGCDLQDKRIKFNTTSLVQSSQGDWAAFMTVSGDADIFSDETGNLWACNIDTGEAYALSTFDLPSKWEVSGGAFSPDGSRIVWTETNEGLTSPQQPDCFSITSRQRKRRYSWIRSFARLIVTGYEEHRALYGARQGSWSGMIAL